MTTLPYAERLLHALRAKDIPTLAALYLEQMDEMGADATQAAYDNAVTLLKKQYASVGQDIDGDEFRRALVTLRRPVDLPDLPDEGPGA